MKNQIKNAAKIAASEKALYACAFAKVDSKSITVNNLSLEYSFLHDIKEVKGEGTIEMKALKQVHEKLKTIDLMYFESGKAFLVSGNTKLSFESIPLEDLPKFDTGEWQSIGKIELNEDFEKAKKFVGNDDIRPYFKAVYFDTAMMAATDAHAMFYKNHGINLSESFLMPPDAFFAKGEQEVSVLGNYIKMEQGGEKITFRKMDEKYPDITQVIPKTNENIFSCNLKELKEAIEVMFLTTNTTTNRIDIFEGTISSEDIDLGKSGKTSINTTVIKGKMPQIIVNGKMLLKGLNALEGKTVEISQNAPSRAIILNDNILIMPLMK